MSLLDTYSALEGLGPVVTTAEAAAALRRSASSASRMLRGLEEAGRVRRLRSGLWAIGSADPDPYAVVSELTSPSPSYVSFLSALNFHGMIDQIPREVSVASLDRARRIKTSVGTFSVHHLPPELFGGWTETSRRRVATPEKAIFDLCYVSVAGTGKPRRVPELELPDSFDRKEIDQWVRRIPSARLATLTKRAVDQTLARATR
jgi:predicted transcriptional regulator of viral defense system